MDSVLASSVVDRGFEPLSGQNKDYKIGICCFSAKHVALRKKEQKLVGWNNSSRIDMSLNSDTLSW
jgi:hypothetical protein